MDMLNFLDIYERALKGPLMSEQDFDMKVFKVLIHLDESNDGLKPAMSSNNEIILTQKDEALFVPLKAVINENGASSKTIYYFYQCQ